MLTNASPSVKKLRQSSGQELTNVCGEEDPFITYILKGCP